MGLNQLSYQILGEIVICILSAVLCFNIFATFSPYERRHRLFLYAGIDSFLTTLFDIAAVICITYYKTIPLWVGTLFSTIFFLLLAVGTFLMSSYVIEIALTYKNKQKVGYMINGIIYLLYALFILINIKTGWLFRYDAELGYIRGPLKMSTFIVTSLYGFITIFVVLLNRKSMAFRLYIVFILFPLISMAIMSFQIMFPKVVLSGTAIFSSILIAYISIQSDMLEFDLSTGLMTAHKLQKHVELKNSEGVLFLLSIGNMNFIQNHMNPIELNKMLLDLGQEFTKRFQRKSYHITTDRFAGMCSTIDEAVKYQQEIRKYIENLNKENTKLPSNLEVYYAAMSFQKGDKKYSDVMDIMNTLLNKAKNHNDYQLQVCNESILLEIERQNIIYDILKEELNPESTKFQVWYQPIYSIKEKRFTHMEALSRLINTRIGNIPPGEFIAIAEEKGLIEKLGFVAFEKICQFLSENHDIINAISVNFSVYQLTTPNCVDYILSTIKKYNLDPSSIIMEITESTFIDNYEIIVKNLYKLANSGILFYLDDFGSGYSNLSNVVQLPFSTIKLDRTLVLMMDESTKNINLFKNLVKTFKDAKFNILVEGIETTIQDVLVKEAGVDYIQGYFYSRPIPPDQCIELLKK